MLCGLLDLILLLCFVNADNMSRNASVPYLLSRLRIMVRVDGVQPGGRLVLSGIRRVVGSAAHLDVACVLV
jgi:hypothetical protein